MFVAPLFGETYYFLLWTVCSSIRIILRCQLTVKYKRSAGLEALHFHFSDMFINIQYVQFKYISRIMLIQCCVTFFLPDFSILSLKKIHLQFREIFQN